MPPEPLVLAFDTSVAHCAAALLSGDRVLGQRLETMARGQAERLFVLLQELLDETGATWRDLARIGVGTGPGNFTGVRISVSAARGLALSLGIPAIGVSSFEAQAFNLPHPVISSIDGRAGRLYLQQFTRAGPLPPLAATLDALPGELFTDDQTVVGHDADAICAQTGADTAHARHPIAVAIALIAGRADASQTRRPAPIYMRAPDAAPPRDAAPTILP